MALWKICAAAAAFCLSMAVLPSALQARPLGTVDWMPFFGQPYPNGYVYHPPQIECYSYQVVETPDGPRTAAVWTCGPPVVAKY
jgi:hypothetical protein